jgi:hypothetical protein
VFVILKPFFMWCTIINGALLVLSFLICAYAGEWVYRMHSRYFSISREAFNVAIYSFIGLFKMVILVFNLVPYIACIILAT